MRQLSLYDLFDALQNQPTVSQEVGVASAREGQECKFMHQFRDIKNQYPDALLLFRCGDFYEAYNEDARNACDILGITLTHTAYANLPVCGFPFHALDTYLPKLVRAGCRVAICDPKE